MATERRKSDDPRRPRREFPVCANSSNAMPQPPEGTYRTTEPREVRVPVVGRVHPWRRLTAGGAVQTTVVSGR
jgi:hypothetical protein